MTTTLSEITQLSIAGRIQLAEDIWDTIAPEDVPVPETRRAELDRRLDPHHADPQQGASWQDVQQRVRGQR